MRWMKRLSILSSNDQRSRQGAPLGRAEGFEHGIRFARDSCIIVQYATPFPRQHRSDLVHEAWYADDARHWDVECVRRHEEVGGYGTASYSGRPLM